VRFADQAAFVAWLSDHHATHDELVVEIAKKASPTPSISQQEAVEAALCFGWIDGVVRRVDDEWFAQRFTPRRARSKWSKVNCAKAEALIAGGLMRPAGLAEVDRAKADGRWDAAYDPPSRITVPADLQAALDADDAAAAAFTGLDAQNRYAILYRVHDAKRPETRQRRIEQFVAMLARGERPLG
jgi:uncharacterized protein YdeI (YjbR/CyaY-like superfamily)